MTTAKIEVTDTLLDALNEIARLNGTESLDNDQDSFGYIDISQKLQIPMSIAAKLDNTISGDYHNIYQDPDLADLPQLLDADEIMAVAFANVQCFKVEPEFNAMLRAHLLCRGFYTKDLSDRFVFIDEYNIINDSVKSLNANKSKDAYDKMSTAYARVVQTWRHIVCMVYYTFKQTGHHYIDNDTYNKKYERMIKSAQFNEADAPESYLDTFRTMIHPFGVRVLYDAVHYYCRANLIDNAFFVRWNTSPCGTSVVISTAAVFDTMIPLPWYSTFYAAMKDQIDALYMARDFIRKMDIKCHLMARLFGYPRPYLEDLNKIGKLLTPYAKAFTILYCANTPLNEAMAVKKWADQNPGIMNLFTKLLTFYDKQITSSESLLQAFKSTVGKLSVDYSKIEEMVFGDLNELANVTYYGEPEKLTVSYMPRLLLGDSVSKRNKTTDINEQYREYIEEKPKIIAEPKIVNEVVTRLFASKDFTDRVKADKLFDVEAPKQLNKYEVEEFDDDDNIIDNTLISNGDEKEIINLISVINYIVQNTMKVQDLVVGRNYVFKGVGYVHTADISPIVVIISGFISNLLK